MQRLIRITCVAMLLSGCATYRVTSNIPSAGEAAAVGGTVMVLQAETLQRAYQELGPIQVTVRKGNPFMATPTHEQADLALRQKARDMGAEAIIRVHYEEGFGLMSGSHIKAEGIAIRFTE